MYKQKTWVRDLCWNIELLTVAVLETCLSVENLQLLCADLSRRALCGSETVTGQKLCLWWVTGPKNFIWVRRESFSSECQSSYVQTCAFLYTATERSPCNSFGFCLFQSAVKRPHHCTWHGASDSSQRPCLIVCVSVTMARWQHWYTVVGWLPGQSGLLNSICVLVTRHITSRWWSSHPGSGL